MILSFGEGLIIVFGSTLFVWGLFSFLSFKFGDNPTIRGEFGLAELGGVIW